MAMIINMVMVMVMVMVMTSHDCAGLPHQTAAAEGAIASLPTEVRTAPPANRYCNNII
jgi:hypothetical protein